MASLQYNLKWNNHQRHVFSFFEALLQTESLVDVTLVCEDALFKVHRIVLSACSSYFAKIFSETPGKHLTVILNNMMSWELRLLVDFMYRGEILVSQDQLPELMKAADALQIHGLGLCKQEPHMSPSMMLPQQCLEDSAPSSPGSIAEEDYAPSELKLSRSEDVDEGIPLELNGSAASPPHSRARPQRRRDKSPVICPMVAMTCAVEMEENEEPLQLLTKKEVKFEEEDDEEQQEQLDLSGKSSVDWRNSGDDGGGGGNNNGAIKVEERDFVPSPAATLLMPSLREAVGRTGHSVSRNNGSNTSSTSGVPMFSAPRGGPPRHWSNENLTEALRHVWSGRMKTAQASRVFGIPYNSLLMYVRGKYGKSLKLDLIRKGEIPSHLASEPFHLRSSPPSTSASFLAAAAAAAAVLPRADHHHHHPHHHHHRHHMSSLMLEDLQQRSKLSSIGVAAAASGPPPTSRLSPDGDSSPISSSNRRRTTPTAGTAPLTVVGPPPPLGFFPPDPALRSLGMLNNLLNNVVSSPFASASPLLLPSDAKSARTLDDDDEFDLADDDNEQSKKQRKKVNNRAKDSDAKDLSLMESSAK